MKDSEEIIEKRWDLSCILYCYWEFEMKYIVKEWMHIVRKWIWCKIWPIQSPCTTAPWGGRTAVSVRTRTQSTGVCGAASRRPVCTRSSAVLTSKGPRIPTTSSVPTPRSPTWVVTLVNVYIWIGNSACFKALWLSERRHWLWWLDYWHRLLVMRFLSPLCVDTVVCFSLRVCCTVFQSIWLDQFFLCSLNCWCLFVLD